jgi:DnaK suppressor protein
LRGNENMKGTVTPKKNLLKMRDEILEELDETIKTIKSAPERDVGDFYDDADIEKGRQMTHLLGERERAKLEAIDNALEKIEDGTYGKCEECGEDINKKRLKIIPFARYCVKCQSDMEKKGIGPGESAEDNSVYKNVSINDFESSDE